MTQPVSTPAEPFDAAELREVCPHYKLGKITSIREYRGGASAAPKAVIESALGRFLLKRRARGLDDPYRVAFAHEVQLHLRSAGYPAPRLVGTRNENNSMLQLNAHVYELFVFVNGDPFDRSPQQSRLGGEALGVLHNSLKTFKPSFHPASARGDGVSLVEIGLARAYEAGGELASAADKLGDLFEASASALADRTPMPGIVHGDWHPGNLLFRNGRVAGVFDYDGARFDDPAEDFGQGLAQYTFVYEGMDPRTWPNHADERRLAAFWEGYRSSHTPPAGPEHAAPLMIRGLAIEAMGALASAQAASISPALLDAVARKAAWLADHAARIAGVLRDAANPAKETAE